MSAQAWRSAILLSLISGVVAAVVIVCCGGLLGAFDDPGPAPLLPPTTYGAPGPTGGPTR